MEATELVGGSCYLDKLEPEKQNIMYYYFTILLSILAFSFSFSQECQTEKIRIEYTNALEIFHVCKNNPKINFKQNKKYTWYTEFSGIKETEGGSGGNLLHGSYKFYDSTRNLREEKNYYLGQIHGEWKSWDKEGNLTSHVIVDKDSGFKYWKWQLENGHWNEWIGNPLEPGSIQKVYNEYKILISTREVIDYAVERWKEYYDNKYGIQGSILAEYTVSGSEWMRGEYIEYYENGNIKVEGQYMDEKYVNIRTGDWKWYHEDGSLDVIEKYKGKIEYWNNGEKKVVGGYIFDEDNKQWLKTGEWRWYDQNGKFKGSKNYKWGVEIEDEE